MMGDIFELGLVNFSELPDRIFSIAEDASGELYLVGGSESGGPVVIVDFLRLPGDLDRNGVTDLLDWNIFKSSQGFDFATVDTSQSYL